MRPLGALILSIVAACVLSAPARAADNKLPADVHDVLLKAGQFDVLALDPTPGSDKTPEGFHGYKILGKTTVKDAAVHKDLIQALVKGMEGNIAPARCFNPRHGVHATHEGKTVDLVICFECAQIYSYGPSAQEHQELLVGKSPEPAFDKVLKDAGIAKAK